MTKIAKIIRPKPKPKEIKRFSFSNILSIVKPIIINPAINNPPVIHTFFIMSFLILFNVNIIADFIK